HRNERRPEQHRSERRYKQLRHKSYRDTYYYNACYKCKDTLEDIQWNSDPAADVTDATLPPVNLYSQQGEPDQESRSMRDKGYLEELGELLDVQHERFTEEYSGSAETRSDLAPKCGSARRPGLGVFGQRGYDGVSHDFGDASALPLESGRRCL